MLRRPSPSSTLFSPRGMPAPRALCFSRVNFFLSIYLFLTILSAKLSQDPPDRFSPHFHRLTVNYRTDRLFPIAQETLTWQPILGSKWAISTNSFLFVAFGLQYHHSDFKRFIFDDLATL